MLALALDIGNSHTVAGLFNSEGKLDFQVRFRTIAETTSDEYRQLFFQLIEQRSNIKKDQLKNTPVVVCSVVPSLDRTLREAFEDFPFLKITSDTHREFTLERLPHPNSLGADRLANLAGALALGKGPFLVVDAGTATTFCLMDEHNRYWGGAISPGLEISWKALQDRAAKLFAIELKYPEQAIGLTTETQLKSGVLLGYQHLITGLSTQLIKEAAIENPLFKNARWLITGGCSHLLQLPTQFEVHPDLTLLGLNHYRKWNRTQFDA